MKAQASELQAKVLTGGGRKNQRSEKASLIHVFPCDKVAELLIDELISLSKILQRYQVHSDAEVAGGSVQESEKLPVDLPRSSSLLEMVQSHLKEQNVEELKVAEIVQLEHHLDAILHKIRIRKSQKMKEAVTALYEKEHEKQMREGNQFVGKEILCQPPEQQQQMLTTTMMPEEDLFARLHTYPCANTHSGAVPPSLQQEDSFSSYLL